MFKTNKKVIYFFLIFLVILIAYIFISNNYIYTLSKYGSNGEEVKQIQTKLKRWGYYNGAVDGIYGSKTQAAVRKFQQKNNLKVDGIAGKETLTAMGLNANTSNSSSSSTSNSSTSNSDLNLLARLVYAEARGESYTGQVAVAAVVLNRVKSSSFPNTVAGVIYQSRSI